MGAYVGWSKFSITKSKEGKVDVTIYTNEAMDVLYNLTCEATYAAPAVMPLERR